MGTQITVIDQLQPLGEGERVPAGRTFATDAAENLFTGISLEDAPDVSWTAGNTYRWNLSARELEPGFPVFSLFQLYGQDEISRILEQLRGMDAVYLNLSEEESETFNLQTKQLISVFEYASKLPEAGVAVS